MLGLPSIRRDFRSSGSCLSISFCSCLCKYDQKVPSFIVLKFSFKVEIGYERLFEVSVTARSQSIQASLGLFIQYITSKLIETRRSLSHYLNNYKITKEA